MNQFSNNSMPSLASAANPNAANQQGIDLSNYADRKAKGFIFWTNENGVAVLNVKQFDAAHNETGVLKYGFSTAQIGKIRNDFDREILNLKDQRYAIDERISAIEKQKSEMCDALEADIAQAENAKSENTKE